MTVFKLLRGNDQLPPESMVSTGDLALFSQGDLMCFMGDRWKMLGGRFLTAPVRDKFVVYISSGWGDATSIEWDLKDLFEAPPQGVPGDSIFANPEWSRRFFNNVLETCRELEDLTGTKS